MAQTLQTLGNQAMFTSIYGRRLGLASDGTLVGPSALKRVVQDLTTATTATTVNSFGTVRQSASGSSQGPTQHLLGAPIPGVSVTLILDSSSTGSHQFLSSAAGAAIRISSLGTTIGVLNLLGPASFMELEGVTTALWLIKSRSYYSSTALADTVSFTTST